MKLFNINFSRQEGDFSPKAVFVLTKTKTIYSSFWRIKIFNWSKLIIIKNWPYHENSSN